MSMIISLCGSMAFHKEMLEVKKKLEEMKHTVYTPHLEYGDFHRIREQDERKWKILKKQFIKDHFKNIKKSDAILVLNFEKNGIKNYIGGNTLFEIAVAFEFNKKIFLLNPIPENSFCTEELEVINPVILNGDLDKIRQDKLGKM